MPTEYRKWWDFFRARNDQHELYIKWFSEHQDELPNITSMISVGAGCGDLDAELVKTSLTGLQVYTGVEPDPDNRNTLTATMSAQCPNIKVVADPIGVWQGPAEPVDLVLAIQVFYYFQDKVAALKQLYSWLRPGGVLIIGLSHDDNMYAGVAREAGLNGDYWMSSLTEDVEKSGFNHFKEYQFLCNVTHGCTLNEDMVKHYFRLNILKGQECSEVNVQTCLDIFRKRFEERDPHQTYHNGIIVVVK